MTSYLMMTALLAVAALWLTRPLWLGSRHGRVQRRHANVAAYRTRLTELESDVLVGVVPADEAQAIKQEMESRLLRDADGEPERVDVSAPRRGLAAALLTVLLAGFAGVWYWQAGSWQQAADIASAPLPGVPPTDAEIEGMVSKLAARLQANPQDAEGWAMLGRSYFVMGRHTEAAASYGKANALAADNAAWLVNEGEALALSRDRDLLGRPAALFDAALKAEPDNGKALWYGALADAQAAQFPRAKQRLQQLLAQDLPDELRTTVQSRMAELAELSGEPAAAVATAAPTTKPASSAAAAVTLQISLSAEVSKQIPPNATLFVFAKAAKGPPMPLAVQRLPGATLPLTITLDDSMAMTPAMKLSQFDRYVFTARLSKSGSAPAASGDLEGSVELGRGEIAGPVTVVIDRVVP